MTPVDTTPSSPGCLSACLASILGLSRDEVPIFVDCKYDRVKRNWVASMPGDDGWIYQMIAWGHKRGIQIMPIPSVVIDHRPYIMPAGVHIRSGPSTIDGVQHAVIYCGEKMIHDPTTPRLGITETTDYFLIVPLEPAMMPVPCCLSAPASPADQVATLDAIIE